MTLERSEVRMELCPPEEQEWAIEGVLIFDDEDRGWLAKSGESTGRYSLAMYTSQWEDFGRPEVVTVTIESGDRLNS